MADAPTLEISKGSPSPLGVSMNHLSLNFAIVSTQATEVSLCLYDRATERLIAELTLSPEINKTGDVWHVAIKNLPCDVVYAYRMKPLLMPEQGLLLDPYAKCTNTSNVWGKNSKLPLSQQNSYQPLGEIIFGNGFDWENDTSPGIPLNQLMIYEMHVRGYTEHSSSCVNNPGTFLGFIEKIPHLIELGINAVKLLPIQEFNELEYQRTHPSMKSQLFNYWGYSTVNYFSPMNRYASSMGHGAAINEFKTLVKALHKKKIEVILDIVFNHTAEGGQNGVIHSFKGIDNPLYYLLDEKNGYLDYSGCGNTVNANNPIVIELIISCLRYWVTEMHVDGFRFDLASALTRNLNGKPMEAAPLIEAISKDPILANVKLIAEPWDAAGLYQVGNFSPGSKRWSEWNGKYRDNIRRFIKGTPWTSGEFAMRLCGSDDLYRDRGPTASINFVTCHDGFTLADLVSYNQKHNLPNGENNRDGSNDNESWNCGAEGLTANPKILSLRQRQMRNFHLALMLSQGVPMVLMGDEYGHTKDGNNNTWCQDNDLNWFLWDKLEENQDFYRFYRALIHFRKKHPILQRTTFLTNQDVDWHGIEPFKPDWNRNTPFVALTLKDIKSSNDLYIAFNAQDHAQSIHLPQPAHMRHWRWVVNTANPPPTDYFDNGPFLLESNYRMNAFSAILLVSSL